MGKRDDNSYVPSVCARFFMSIINKYLHNCFLLVAGEAASNTDIDTISITQKSSVDFTS